jgi:predicted SnoaL-like aldol condensation-catalyzing enzyme
MAKTKEIVEEVVVEVVAESEAKKAFRKLMDTYQKQNPSKFEAKKEALEAKLNSL